MNATKILSRLIPLHLILPLALGAQAAFGGPGSLPGALRDSTGASVSVAAPATIAAAKDSLGPSSFAYKGVTITPIAFFAMEALWRQRNETADIGSSFNAIPFNNSTNGQLSEFRATARQSRLGLAIQGTTGGGVKIGGFWESDFLSSGITSNSNESNSYTFRVRQFFGQALFPSGLGISAGQMWSLITPDKSGVMPRAEYNPGTIDAQYAVGYNWARQAALRVTQKVNDVVSVAAALEESQMTYAARNAPANVFIGNTGGSLLNGTTNYSTDLAPDLVGKIAFDQKGFGHFEIKAVGRVFRDRFVDPAGTAGGSHTNSAFGGGMGASAFLTFSKAFDLGINALAGKGIGRYGTSGLPDATINPDGSLAPIKAAHALVTLDVHATPQLDVYGYGGVEYADRTSATNSAGKGVGYGSPLLTNAGCDAEYIPTGPYSAGGPGGSNPACNADTRTVYQGNLGFWYRFYRGPAGTFQWGAQYSYTARTPWSGAGFQPKAIDNMVFSSVRYYLP
jgi:hypothetical protein